MLGRAAEFLLNGALVHRAVYLGVDGALDRAVAAWAEKLVGGDDPSDDAAWRRAANIALAGTPAQIDRFVGIERARLRLKSLETFPDREGRSVEMIGERVALLVHDKATLTEDDIAAASLLVFGSNPEPLVRAIGTRWFVSPGDLGTAGGLAVLDDQNGEIEATLYDPTGRLLRTEVLGSRRGPRMTVRGE